MRKLENIQHLRGLASLLVLLSHASNVAGRIDPTSVHAVIPDTGHFGVDVFFVISGFIMYFTTRGEFGKPTASAGFMAKRLIRIVPLYWAALLVYVTLKAVSGQGFDPAGMLRSLSFIPYRSEEGLFRPELGVGWSLNFEMLFYVAFAIGLFFRRGLLVIAGLLVALIMAAVVAPVGPLQFWGSPIVLEFLIGVGIGWLYDRWPERHRLSPLPIILALFAIEFAVLWFAPKQPEFGWRIIYWLLAAAVMAVALWAPPPPANRASKALTGLGDASYSIYLIHPIFVAIASSVLGRWVHNGWLMFALLASGALVAGCLAYVLFERPLTGWLQGRAPVTAAAFARRSPAN